MKNRRISNFIDGFIRVYQSNEEYSSFGAKRNAKTVDDLTFIVKLAYEETYKRQQDLDFAEASGRTLSLKVKTRYYKGIQTDYKVIIDGCLYDIIDLDIDRYNQEMFFYLEYVKEVNLDE
ncbi:MAG: phage head closure protein [Intestinibacter sp.]|uniref:phage head closure protein n=1 Tax=Intestinibacter sp. TaxID=1965304 RepID=UPI003F149159